MAFDIFQGPIPNLPQNGHRGTLRAHSVAKNRAGGLQSGSKSLGQHAGYVPSLKNHYSALFGTPITTIVLTRLADLEKGGHRGGKTRYNSTSVGPSPAFRPGISSGRLCGRFGMLQSPIGPEMATLHSKNGLSGGKGDQY